LETWKKDSLTDEMETSFSDWLNGRIDGIKPGLVTITNPSNDKTRPPYHHYTKYNVVSEPVAVADTETVSDESCVTE